LGINVLKVYNSLYSEKDYGVIYSQHIMQKVDNVYCGWSNEYTEDQIKYVAFRDMATKAGHLRSFNASNFRKVRDSDFKDENGQFWRSG
jgi:hypothetical protein